MAATEREAKEEDSWSDCHGTSWPQCLGPTKPPSVSISESADTAERFEPRASGELVWFLRPLRVTVLYSPTLRVRV